MTHPHPGVRAALAELLAAHDALQARSWPGGPAEYEQHRDRLRTAWTDVRAALAAPLEPPDRDKDWVLAMGHALGLNSGYTVPIVPTVEAFKAHYAQFAQATPLSVEPVAIPRDSDLPRLIFEAIGYASMCWRPRPSHEVFDTEEATKCAEKLIDDVRALYASPPPVAESADALDAKRYRWLRDTTDSLDSVLLKNSSDGPEWRAGAQLDAAIDAAIAAAPAGGEPPDSDSSSEGAK